MLYHLRVHISNALSLGGRLTIVDGMRFDGAIELTTWFPLLVNFNLGYPMRLQFNARPHTSEGGCSQRCLRSHLHDDLCFRFRPKSLASHLKFNS